MKTLEEIILGALQNEGSMLHISLKDKEGAAGCIAAALRESGFVNVQIRELLSVLYCIGDENTNHFCNRCQKELKVPITWQSIRPPEE